MCVNKIEYFEPAQYGKSIGKIISEFVYPSAESGLNEYIDNAFDQYQDKKTQQHEGYNIVNIEVDPIHRKLRIIDYATGIEDLIKFKKFASDDDEVKKIVGTEVCTIQNPHDLIMGQFHIGKGSAKKMSVKEEGDIATFRSNNGERGDILILRWKDGAPGWDEGFRYPKEQASLAKQDIGLSVEIHDVVDELLDINKIKKIISTRFGILIARGFKIYIKNMAANEVLLKVESPENLDTKHEIHRDEELKMSTGRYISYSLNHNIKPKLPNLDIYKAHRFIKSIRNDAAVEGWINCNDLRLTLAKDNIQDDDRSREMFSKLNPWLIRTFGEQHKETPKLTHEKDLKKLLSNLLESVNVLFPEDQIILSGMYSEYGVAGQITTKEKQEKEKEEWIKKEKQKLTKEGGSEEGDPIIPIGEGHRGGGDRTEPTEGGKKPSVENEGDHDIIKKSGHDDNRPLTGSVKPDTNFIIGPLGQDKPICEMNMRGGIIFNEDRELTGEILKFPIQQRLAILSPLMSDAIVQRITESRPIHKKPTIEEFRKMSSDLISRTMLLNLKS